MVQLKIATKKKTVCAYTFVSSDKIQNYRNILVCWPMLCARVCVCVFANRFFKTWHTTPNIQMWIRNNYAYSNICATNVFDRRSTCVYAFDRNVAVGRQCFFMFSVSMRARFCSPGSDKKKIRTNWFLKTFFFFATFRFVFVWLRASLHRVTFFFSAIYLTLFAD